MSDERIKNSILEPAVCIINVPRRGNYERLNMIIITTDFKLIFK